MSKNNNSIINLVVILAILLGIIAGVYSYKYNPVSISNNFQTTDKKVSQNEILVFNSNINKSTKKTIRNDKFVAKLDKNSNMIITGKNGYKYSVKKGKILMSGFVINNNDKSYSIYNINSPKK